MRFNLRNVPKLTKTELKKMTDQKQIKNWFRTTVREIERLHRRRFKLHQVETSSENIPAWGALEWSCLLPIAVIFFLGAKLGE